MEKFENQLDPSKFRSTNSAWNELRLNAPWNVGYVATVIEAKPFSSKEEWERFYYESGRQRNDEIGELPSEIATQLNDKTLPKTDPGRVKSFDKRYKRLNFNRGRTRDQLGEIGQMLYKHVAASGTSISQEECAECVRFRTICETWNGVVIRERNTVETLEREFPDVSFEQTRGEKDHDYAIDYEILVGDQVACGIQIKPVSYKKRLWVPYLKRAHQANKRKHRAYERDYGCKAFYIYSESSGEIVNGQDAFPLIRQAVAAI